MIGDLLYFNRKNLTDKHPVIILLRIIIGDRRIDKILGIKILIIYDFTFNYQPGFGKINGPVSGLERRYPGFFRFVDIPSGPGSAKFQYVPVFFLEK